MSIHSLDSFDSTQPVATIEQDPIQLEDCVKAVTDSFERSASELRGLMTDMSVAHIEKNMFLVEWPYGEETVDIGQETCTCGSSVLENDDWCAHLWHLFYRDRRGLLPNSIETPLDASVHPPHSLSCDVCGNTFPDEGTNSSNVHISVCNSCAVQNDNILRYTPMNRDAMYVYFNQLICPATVETYKFGEGITLYDYFEKDNRVQPDDGIVQIFEPLSSNSNGFVFSDKRTVVPSTLVVRAVDLLPNKGEQ